MASVKWQDRRDSEHDEICAVVLAKAGRAIGPHPEWKLPRGAVWNSWVRVWKEEAWKDIQDPMDPHGWGRKRDEWPWARQASSLSGSTRTVVTGTEVEAKLGGGYADVVIRGHWETDMNRNVICTRVSPYPERCWSIDEFSWTELVSQAFRVIVEVKSSSEKFSAGDVLRQLKSYMSAVRSTGEIVRGVLVMPGELPASGAALLSHEGIAVLSTAAFKDEPWFSEEEQQDESQDRCN